MRQYSVFGGCLHSDLEFPSLAAAPSTSASSWRLRVRDRAAPERTLAPLSAEQLSEQVSVAVSRFDGGLRVSYSDTGSYELTDGGRTITWYRPAGSDATNARLDVLGTLLILALHLEGQLSLHGSAISLESGVVAFLAPSGFGKSTLAMALATAGGRFMSDDAVPVRIVDGQVVASPGVPSPRFLADSFARFRDVVGAPVSQGDGKVTAGDRLPADLVETRERPLSAVYVLRPVLPNGAPPTRAPLPPMLATIELLRNAKLAKLLWGEESQRLLALVTDVASHVDVWMLDVPRDLDLLPAVVQQLLEWHAPFHPQLA
jgi:hypothetical protein